MWEKLVLTKKRLPNGRESLHKIHMTQKLKEDPFACTMFGGDDADQYNALASALWASAGGKEKVYEYLSDTPKTSLVVELVDTLRARGFKIVSTKSC